MIRLGLVGIGGYGWTLAQWIEAVSSRCGCRLVAAADVRLREFPERVTKLTQDSVELFDDALEMFRAMEGRCDAVYIASSIGSHAALTVAAAQCGYHVHLEKPPAATVQEVEAMLEALARAGRFCLVGFQALHSRDILLIKERVVSGRLGQVESLSCQAGWPRWRDYYTRNEWAGKLRSGRAWVLDGPATNALAHQIANMLSLASAEPNRLACPTAVRAELYAAGPIESHDTAAIEILTAEGPRAYFLASHCPQRHFGPTIEIDARNARVRWAMRRGLTIEYRDGSRESFGFDHQQHAGMVANFVEAVRSGSGANLRCSLEESRKVVLALNGAHESSGRIHRIGRQYSHVEDEAEDNPRTVVDGLDAWLSAADGSRCLLSDLPDGPAWAAPTEAYDLAGYKGFPQRFSCE